MAANSSPAILPVTNPQSTSAADGAQQPSPTSAVRSFLSGISETVTSGLSNRRPWTELLDRSAFSKPESVSDATARIRKNYNYFRVNYLTVLTAVVAVSLLTNPLSLIFVAVLLAAWLFLYLFRQPSDPPIEFFGRQFSDRETLFFLIVSTVAVLFLTSVGSVLASALMIGASVVCFHSVFRTPEDLFLDGQEPAKEEAGILVTGSASAILQGPSSARG